MSECVCVCVRCLDNYLIPLYFSLEKQLESSTYMQTKVFGLMATSTCIAQTSQCRFLVLENTT